MNHTPQVRRILRHLCLFFPLLALVASARSAPAPIFSENDRPEWQWSTPITNTISKETNDHPRAFLWIPPDCRRVRAVVVGQNNMEEEQILENPAFRRTLADLNFAAVWVTPPFDGFFRFDEGAGFDEMMKALAAESGYSELALAPVVPIGHSAAASYPWFFAFWAPERTLAAISVSGQWPYWHDKNSPDIGNRTLDGVPGLVTMGEYENAYDRASTGLAQRAEHPLLPLSMLAEPAGEHFGASDVKISFLGLYLRKAAQYRLPADWPIDQRPKLNPIDPTKTGWLVDRGHPDGKPAAPAAPVGLYTGDPKDAFWVFDGELAAAVEKIGALYAGKKLDQIAYVQNGRVVPQRRSHVRVGLALDFKNDDLTFKLGSTFLDTVPVDWRGLTAGDPIAHPSDSAQLRITRICGPVEQVGPGTYALRFYRGGFDNPKRSGGIGVILSDPGDATYRPMSLEAELKVPLVNKDGDPQSIAFSAPASVSASTRAIDLSASSSAGLPVFFYVREGPAVIDGHTLRFTAIPPRAKFPVKVTVVAWQWGRPYAPKVQSAQPVTRTILITR